MKFLFKRFITIVLFAFCIVTFPCSCVWNSIEDRDATDPGGPVALTIQSIDPEAAEPGMVVRILGTGFSPIASENLVRFGELYADIDSASTKKLVVKVPVGAETASVEVIVNSKSATVPSFTVLAPPPSETPETPEVPELLPYFIKFKFNDELKIFQESDPEFQNCETHLCCFTPAHAEPFADLAIGGTKVRSAEEVLALKGKTLSFLTTEDKPVFGFTENNFTRSSASIIEQEDSWVKITNVEADGETSHLKGFKVSGVFQCKAKNQDETVVGVVTEGEFVLRYTAPN